MTVMQGLLFFILASLLIVAAVSDLRTRIISNRLNAAVALLAPAWWLASGLGASDVAVQIAIALATFGLFAGLFSLGWMGGGDVKLIAALALWLPALPLLRMLIWMVLAGGLLSLAVMVHHRRRKGPDAPEVPYGVAIAAATLLVFTNQLLTIRDA